MTWIATRIADTLCGGVIVRGSTVDEECLITPSRIIATSLISKAPSVPSR